MYTVKRLFIFLCSATLTAFASKEPSTSGALTPFFDETTRLYGFKDLHGKVVMAPQFEHVGHQHGPSFAADHPQTAFLTPVWKFGQWWQMDRQGQLKFSSIFYDNGADYYVSGLTRFLDRKEEKVGFHNTKGEIVIAAKFDYASPFEKIFFGKEEDSKQYDGQYAIVALGCWLEKPAVGYKYRPMSSNSGHCLINPSDGCRLMAESQLCGGRWGAIDRNGTVIIPLEHDGYEAVRLLLMDLEKKEYEEAHQPV